MDVVEVYAVIYDRSMHEIGWKQLCSVPGDAVERELIRTFKWSSIQSFVLESRWSPRGEGRSYKRRLKDLAERPPISSRQETRAPLGRCDEWHVVREQVLDVN